MTDCRQNAQSFFKLADWGDSPILQAVCSCHGCKMFAMLSMLLQAKLKQEKEALRTKMSMAVYKEEDA